MGELGVNSFKDDNLICISGDAKKMLEELEAQGEEGVGNTEGFDENTIVNQLELQEEEGLWLKAIIKLECWEDRQVVALMRRGSPHAAGLGFAGRWVDCRRAAAIALVAAIRARDGLEPKG